MKNHKQIVQTKPDLMQSLGDFEVRDSEHSLALGSLIQTPNFT